MFKRFGGFGIYSSVNRIVTFIAAILLAFGVLRADAAATRATLVLSAQTAKPGDTISAAVRLEMSSGWHTYWKNSGASGIATAIEWELPPGVTAGEISWPVPEKYIPEKVDDEGKPVAGALDFDQTTYVHHDEAVLLVPLTIASDVAAGRIEIKALVKWLECQVNCVPGKQEVTAALQVGPTTTPTTAAASFVEWQKRLPKSGDSLTPLARWENSSGNNKSRALLIEWQSGGPSSGWDFFPDRADDYEIQHATELVSTNNSRVVLRKLVTIAGSAWPNEISGLLIQTENGKPEGYSVRLKISGAAATPGAGEVASAAPTREKKPLWLWLIYAFIGGLILNIMPCVLPVIALKILGFVGQAKAAPGRVRALGLVYAAGVLVSFLTLAAVIIAIKAAGHKAGWGMQFSNPQFIVGMAALITLVALNLFGVFEVTLSGRVLGTAGELASQHGASGAFFNGVLATALSTPCSAPYLGAALGFAFLQPAGIIVLIFLTVGLGLAAPYVILSWHPAWLKFLPKPGAWMEKFKMAMGFPMLITAVWLASLVVTFYSEQSWWLGVFLVLLGAAAWVFGEFYQRGSRARATGLLFTLLLLVAGYLWALEFGLDWRHPQEPQKEETVQKVAYAPQGYPWQPWSPEAVTKARAAGKVVVVDFTASWCQTCKINVKPGFEAKAVIAKMKQLDAVALLADYTSTPDEMTRELEKFGRSAVPVVLVYPADATKPAVVLADPVPFVSYAPVILKALEKL